MLALGMNQLNVVQLGYYVHGWVFIILIIKTLCITCDRSLVRVIATTLLRRCSMGSCNAWFCTVSNRSKTVYYTTMRKNQCHQDKYLHVMNYYLVNNYWITHIPSSLSIRPTPMDPQNDDLPAKSAPTDHHLQQQNIDNEHNTKNFWALCMNAKYIN